MKNSRNKHRTSFLLITITLLITLIFPQCSQNPHSTKPQEIIEFLTIEPGKTTTVTVSDLFFAQAYDIKFEADENIQLEYNPAKNQLSLTPADGFSGLRMILFHNQGKLLTLPVIVKEKVAVSFKVKVDQADVPVFVMGNFNNWSRDATPMSDPDKDGVFSTDVLLDDGIYEYQFVIGNREIYDPENPVKVDNGFGYFNSLIHVKSANRDSVPNVYFLPGNDDHFLNLAIAAPNDNIEITILIDNLPFSDRFVTRRNKTVTIDLQTFRKDPTLRMLRVVATYKNKPGNILNVWIKNGNPSESEDSFIWQDAIIYSLMIDRFVNGNPGNDDPVDQPQLDWRANFFGGDFAGVTQKIESGYFDSLGINTLWISPVNKTTDKAYREYPEPHRYYTGYHGYWPISPDETEPRFGSLEEFKQLVNTAHRHGITVLLDFVSNHVHIEHEYFRQHRDWFGSYDLPDGRKNIRLWDEFRLTTWFDTFLASFDYVNSPEAVDAMTDNAVWWLKETDIDGFRHDATKHIPYSFWRELTRKIKTEVAPSRGTDIYQIGETFGGDDLIKSFVNNGMLTSQFNFGQYFALRRIFTDPNGDLSELSIAINKAFEVYGYNHVMGNILDSHDQIRIMGLLEGDITMAENGVERAFQEPKITVDEYSTYQKAQILFCYLLTVPGVPIIYYGDEFGMTGANDPDNRRMMRFDEQLSDKEKAQLGIVKKIIQLRKNYSCLRRGDYVNLYSDKDALIFSRGDVQHRIIVMMNKSTDSKTIDLILPGWMTGKTLKSLMTNNQVKISDQKLSLNLPGLCYDIMMVK